MQSLSSLDVLNLLLPFSPLFLLCLLGFTVSLHSGVIDSVHVAFLLSELGLSFCCGTLSTITGEMQTPLVAFTKVSVSVASEIRRFAGGPMMNRL